MCNVDRLRNVADLRRPGRFDMDVPAANQNGDDDSGCLIYSIGSNGNYVFEGGLVDIIGPICEIHVFDPGSFERPDKWADNIVYHPWGLVSSYDIYPTAREGEYYSFQEIQRLLGHENRTVDIFKIDCEGCEWYVQIIDDLTPPSGGNISTRVAHAPSLDVPTLRQADLPRLDLGRHTTDLGGNTQTTFVSDEHQCFWDAAPPTQCIHIL